MCGQSAPDQRIAALASRQQGVVSHGQLLALGLPATAINRRLLVGRLQPIHRGVYAVGHRALAPNARWLAAVLACGPGAVLSHVSAAALWGVRPTSSSRTDVTIASRAGRRQRAGIRVHRVRELRDDERTEVAAIPTTTVARTLLDLASVVAGPALARAVERAEILELFDLTAIEILLERHRGRRGTRALSTAVADAAAAPLTRSDLERRMVALCSAHGIPRPRTNREVLGYEVDFLWPRRKLIAEADSYKYHRSRAAFARDRARDAELTVAGYTTVRFTDTQIATTPAAVAARLRELGAH
jgi:very-short-patch-repair endonuclease